MFDPQRLLGQLLGDALGGGFGGRRRRGGGLGFATKAQLGLGALGVAVAAYEHFTKDRAQNAAPVQAARPTHVAMPPPPQGAGPSVSPPPPPPASRVDPTRLPQAQADAVLLVQAMIAAAAADGVIDASERSRLLSHAADAGLDSETRQFLEAELAVPKSADRIGALTRPGLTEDVYTAAALAIDLDHDGEREFLRKLSEALGIDEVARIGIHEKLEGSGSE